MTHTRTFKFGAGTVDCAVEDGAPVRVAHPSHLGMSFLLEETGDDQDWALVWYLDYPELWS